jgi:hypothetical protein
LHLYQQDYRGIWPSHRTNQNPARREDQSAKVEIFRRAVRYITVSGLQIGACSELTNIDGLMDNVVKQFGGEKPPLFSSEGYFDFGRRGLNDLIRNGVPERQRSEAFQSVIFRLADVPASAVDPGEFVPPKLYVSDATIERMAVLLQSNPRGILRLSDELSSLFLNMSRYSGGQDNEFWLEAWNGNSYLVERMSRPPITVEHLLVGVVGGLQPDKLSRSFVGDQDGVYARICFSWPSEPPYRPLTDDAAEIEPEVVNALLRLIKLPCEADVFGKPVPLSAAAREKFEHLRQFLHAGRDALDGREREWWSKVQANVLRLAGTLCFLDWAIKDDGSLEPQCVDEVFVSAAARLACEYFCAALRQIGLSERHANLRRALRWIKATGRTEVSIKDIRRDAMAGSLDAEATLNLVDRLARIRAGFLLHLQSRPVRRAGNQSAAGGSNPLLWAAETAGTAETPKQLCKFGKLSITGRPP